MPEGTATLDEGVKALIADEKSAVNKAIKDLTDHLQKEIDAIKGMIQSIVYVPTYADGQVQFIHTMWTLLRVVVTTGNR